MNTKCEITLVDNFSYCPKSYTLDPATQKKLKKIEQKSGWNLGQSGLFIEEFLMSTTTIKELICEAHCVGTWLQVWEILYEKGMKFKPFWQWNLLHSMFFTSNIKESSSQLPCQKGLNVILISHKMLAAQLGERMLSRSPPPTKFPT